MTCEVAREMIGAYLDGELDPNAEFQIRTHIAECADCTAAENRLRAMQNMMKSGLAYEAPAALESRIRRSLGSGEIDNPAIRRQTNWRQSWMAIAATALLAGGLTFSYYSVRNQVHVPDPLGDEAVSSHVRAMLTAHSMDVVSTDQHTVKPWFNGKLDFSPPVKDLKEQGFPLVGARVDYLDHRPVAALVYQRAKHPIDLFIWPAAEVRSVTRAEHGYNLITWTNGTMAFSAVSDLNAKELQEFADLIPK